MVEFNKDLGEFVVDKDGQKFSVSPGFLLKIMEDKNALAGLLSSTPKSFKEMDFKSFTSMQIEQLRQISVIGDFDIGEKDGLFYFTVKGLHDVTDGFIGHTPELIGYGDSFGKAFDDFYNKLMECPDRVVYQENGFKDFYWDEGKNQFLEYKFVERKK